ncbi:MAG: hypothetical protein LN364_02140 [Candidatus Thermoplasmatota archaeon]|nr:hypothetical protein [Candidatus Thermoplasmatota archaeon]
MKRIASLVFISLLTLSIVFPVVHAYDVGITTEQQAITISISDSGLDVEENIKVANAAYVNMTSVKFWIQQDAFDVEILAVESGNSLSSIVIGSNRRECNLSQYNLSLAPEDTLDIRLTYTLPTDTKHFVKTILYDTASLSITYGSDELYRGEHLVYNAESNSVQVLLHIPTEAPVNIVYIIIIFLLVVVLVASTLLLMRKQRKKAKKSIVESEEALATKKTLLLSLLKDVEKKHRAKDISDETYNKLKEEYKQQAVDVMKKLEDLKN